MEFARHLDPSINLYCIGAAVMQNIKKMGLVLGLAVVSLFVVWVAPALAVSRWEGCKALSGGSFENGECTKEKVNGGFEWDELIGTEEVTSSGELELEDAKATGGATAIKCKGVSTGWVANLTNSSELGEDGVTTVTSVSCTFVKAGSCEESKSVTAKARNLPWGTKLVERGEEVRDEIRSGPKKEEGNGEPGWSIECTVAGILKITDTCERQGNTTNVKPNSTNGTVDEAFDERTQEETMSTCAVGGSNAGLVRGNIVTKARSEKGLRVGTNIFSFLPQKIKFPNTVVGEEKEFTLENLGTNELELVEQKLAGEGAGEYEDQKNCFKKKLAKDKSCLEKIKLLKLNAKKALFEGKVTFIGGPANVPISVKEIET
jgi:hypothetical protein